MSFISTKLVPAPSAKALLPALPRPCGRTATTSGICLALQLFCALGCTGVVTSAPGRASDVGASEDGEGGGDAAAGGRGASDGIVAPMPLRRLTSDEYAFSIQDLLGLAQPPTLDLSQPDGQALSFASNADQEASEGMLEDYADAALGIARSLPSLAGVAECSLAAGEEVCARRFVDSFGARAFRRPVTDDEATLLLDIWRDAKQRGHDGEGAARVLLAAILSAPQLLYKVERGDGSTPEGARGVPLAPYELASRLSFFLWRSLPDAPLLEAARSGALASAEEVTLQAERMMEDPRFERGLAAFTMAWLHITPAHQALLAKDRRLFPDFDGDVITSLRKETVTFVREVVLHGDARLDTLLSAPYSYVDERAARIYGVRAAAAFDKIELDPQRRAGLLTHPSVLATQAGAEDASPTKRGVFLFKEILCGAVPAVPDDIPQLPPPDPKLTIRQQIETLHLQAGGPCRGCHASFDPLGFALEDFDAIGQYRTRHQNGSPVDAKANLEGLGEDIDGTVDGGVALARKLAQSPTVHRCFARQLWRYALQRVDMDADQDALDELDASFGPQASDVRLLIAKLVATEDFRRFVPVP